MKYSLCFFPLVGALIGVLLCAWYYLCKSVELTRICEVAVGVAIPLLVTGGFHVDGFMDTVDAIRSYQNREKKMEILSDPHIGAFSVITLAVYGLLYMAAFSQILGAVYMMLAGAGFVLSRALSGLAVVCFSKAKKSGMLHHTASCSAGRTVQIVLFFEVILCSMYMIYLSLSVGTITVLVALASWGYYYLKMKKEFGGITGDTAGYFVLLCELGIMMTLAICYVVYGL